MHYMILACDYDGTLAKDGIVSQRTIHALERVVASGRKLLLITGRLLEDIQRIFPRLDLFTWVVAENGALFYSPASGTKKLLAEAPPPQFVELLRSKGVTPLEVGEVIVSTHSPYETTVIEAIHELGLEHQVIFNKGAVMVLPAGINKGTGLKRVLDTLMISSHNVVGVGDAENDHSFLSLCECSVAVSNALPALKDRADYVTKADHGNGVVELVDQLVADDLREIDGRVARCKLVLGTKKNNEPLILNVNRTNMLIAGASGSGKSTLAMSLLEQLIDQCYQFCLIDPEGDYETFQAATSLGSSQKEPTAQEMLQLLEKPEQEAIMNLLGCPLSDRPMIARNLLPSLRELQIRLGHPHWLIFDEAHHVFPPEFDAATLIEMRDLFNLLFITAHPGSIARRVLELIDVAIFVGAQAPSVLREFCSALGLSEIGPLPATIDSGAALVWFRDATTPAVQIVPAHPEEEHLRHRRKYAEGNVGEKSFYFRGPEGRLNLRAQNLIIFMQIAQGIDDETWLFHLRKGDYSHWFREDIKDPDLAREAEEVERDMQLSAQESRERIRAAIDKRYTLPD